MRVKGKSSRFIVALLALGALLGVTASAASAAPSAQSGFSYEGTTGDFGGLFSGPARNPVAVDADGRVFVSQGVGFDFQKFEAIPALVDVFAPGATVGSTPLTTIDVGAAGSAPTDLAIDQSTDALYVQDKENGTIKRFTSDGQPTPTYTVDPSFQLSRGESIAVDPTSGDLLVADPNVGGVLRYDPAGTLVATIATAPVSSPQRIATGPDGSFFVAEDGNPDVLRFSGAGSLLGTVSGVGGIQAMSTDPANGRLVVSVGPTIKVYALTGSFLSDAISPNANDSGIAVDGGSGRLYGFVPTGNTSHLNTYTPAVWPGIEGFGPVDVTAHTARFSAEVDPGAGPPAESEARLEYSTDGGSSWKLAPAQPVGGPATIEAELTGLLADFDYLVRLKASNSLTSHTTAPVAIHTTAVAPEVVTTVPTDITETSAVLNGTINPNGRQTTYHFEYGTTSAYGSRIPVGIEAVADDSRAVRAYARTIPGLQPGVSYHFRIVAQNSIGTSFGEDRSFTTTAAGGVVQRGYEQVTPIDKGGRPLTVHYSFLANSDGSALAYSYRGGEQGSPISSFSASYRGPDDWSEADLTVPLNVTPPGSTVENTTMGVSADFTTELVATNRKLTPDATEGGANLYLVDIASRTYTFVATNGVVGYGGLESFVNLQEGTNKFIAGAPDFSWVVFKSYPSLLPGAANGALYRWSEDKGLEVVSEVPGGGSVGANVSSPAGPVIRWASENGSRVYFQTEVGTEGQLYLREGDQPAKPISVSQIEGDSTAPRVGQFFGASKDGRYAFFMSDEGRLTPDAPEPGNAGGEGGVYRYDAVNESLEYLGAEAWRSGGWLAPIAVGDDGRTVYFRPPANESGVPADVRVWRDGVIKQAAPAGLKQAVETSSEPATSPNGRYFAYELFGDIYLFDAEAGTRTCVSCLPGGGSAGATLTWPARIISNRLPQLVTNSGQVFYTASGRLVAADANAKKDVYEYHDGRNVLITPGNAPFDAVLADVSEDGSSVFFSTGQKLVGQDNDESPDFYVSRVGGGLASQNPPPPQECIRDDCKATPAPGPEVPFGGSEAIRGSENVTPKARCKKGTHARKVKGKTRCVKSSKAKKKQKKANSNRRQGR